MSNEEETSLSKFNAGILQVKEYMIYKKKLIDAI